MGREFSPLVSPWGVNLSHPRSPVEEFPTGNRVSGSHCHLETRAVSAVNLALHACGDGEWRQYSAAQRPLSDHVMCVPLLYYSMQLAVGAGWWWCRGGGWPIRPSGIRYPPRGDGMGFRSDSDQGELASRPVRAGPGPGQRTRQRGAAMRI